MNARLVPGLKVLNQGRNGIYQSWATNSNLAEDLKKIAGEAESDEALSTSTTVEWADSCLGRPSPDFKPELPREALYRQAGVDLAQVLPKRELKDIGPKIFKSHEVARAPQILLSARETAQNKESKDLLLKLAVHLLEPIALEAPEKTSCGLTL